MKFETIILDEADQIATITLNRPQALNALTPLMVKELNQALDYLRDESKARALIMTGAGRAFCSGADLESVDISNPEAPGDAGLYLEMSYNPLIERLFALPIPVVTAMNGLAAGAGCSLALSGDIIYAARSSYVLLAFVNIGLVPDMGATWILPRLAGRARAQAMMMLGERVPAEQAEDWGLIYKAVDDGDVQSVARMTARKFAQGPTQAYRLIREGVRACLEQGLSQALWTERSHQRLASSTHDFAEGVRAFLDKRPAKFEGR